MRQQHNGRNVEMITITDEVAIAMKEAGLIKKVIEDENLSDAEKATLYWQQLVDVVCNETRTDRLRPRKVKEVPPKADHDDKPLGL